MIKAKSLDWPSPAENKAERCGLGCSGTLLCPAPGAAAVSPFVPELLGLDLSGSLPLPDFLEN